MKQKFIHTFSHRDDKVADSQRRSWGGVCVKRGNREKRESTEKSTYVCQSKTKRSGEQRRLGLALAQDQSLEVAVAF